MLDNEERIRVGTLHKQVSPFEANKGGRGAGGAQYRQTHRNPVSRPAENWKPLIYCWRGGKRSGAMTIIFSQIGWQARQLEGGYKTYRAGERRAGNAAAAVPVSHRLRPHRQRQSALLQALHAAGGQVLDLEQIARHKGSVLGVLPGKASRRRRCSKA